MNRINPLHILLLLLTIIIFLIVQLTHQKENFMHEKSALSETQKMAEEIKGLKYLYANKNKTKKTLRRILKQVSLVKKIVQKPTKDGVKLTATSLQLKEVNRLTTKIFNEGFHVTMLKIKKKDLKHVSLKMEILW